MQVFVVDGKAGLGKIPVRPLTLAFPAPIPSLNLISEREPPVRSGWKNLVFILQSAAEIEDGKRKCQWWRHSKTGTNAPLVHPMGEEALGFKFLPAGGQFHLCGSDEALTACCGLVAWNHFLERCGVIATTFQRTMHARILGFWLTLFALASVTADGLHALLNDPNGDLSHITRGMAGNKGGNLMLYFPTHIESTSPNSGIHATNSAALRHRGLPVLGRCSLPCSAARSVDPPLNFRSPHYTNVTMRPIHDWVDEV